MIHENNFKYLSPPTIEQIEAAVKAANVTESQFERFHNIYFGAICEVRMGKREMPTKHWHIFFETENSKTGKISGIQTPNTTEKRTIELDAADAGRMTEFG